jgi:hypothetical protein
VRVATSLKILKSYISCNINNCFKKVVASPLLQTVHINFWFRLYVVAIISSRNRAWSGLRKWGYVLLSMICTLVLSNIRKVIWYYLAKLWLLFHVSDVGVVYCRQLLLLFVHRLCAWCGCQLLVAGNTLNILIYFVAAR